MQFELGAAIHIELNSKKKGGEKQMNDWKRSRSAISLGLMGCFLSLIASPSFACSVPQAAPTPPLVVQPVAEQPTELSEAQMAQVKGELSILGDLADAALGGGMGAALGGGAGAAGAIAGAVVGAYLAGYNAGAGACYAK